MLDCWQTALDPGVWLQGLGIPEVVSGHPLRVWLLTELDMRSGCPELGLLGAGWWSNWSPVRVWIAVGRLDL